MNAWSSALSIAHLIGLALALGSATVKVALLFRCRADSGFVPVYTKVAPVMTRLIVLGLILLTLSGIGSPWVGMPVFPLTPSSSTSTRTPASSAATASRCAP